MNKRTQISLSLLVIEGLIAFLTLLSIPNEAGLSPIRLALLGAIVFLWVMHLALLIGTLRNKSWLEHFLDFASDGGGRFVVRFLFTTGLGLAAAAFSFWPFLREPYPPVFIRLYPILGYIGLTCLHWLLFLFWGRFKEIKTQRWLVYAGAVLLGSYFIAGGLFHAQYTNTDPLAVGDQQEYALFTLRVYNSNFTHTGYRHHAPLYPFLQAMFANEASTPESIFALGKQINVALAFIGLALIFIVFKQFFPLLQSSLLTLMVAFPLYLLKGGYLEVEILYYTLAFIGYAMLLVLFNKPNPWLAVGAGLVLGIAYLTKSSVTPTLMLFVLFYILHAIKEAFHARQAGHQIWPEIRQRGLSMLLVLVFFTLVIFPYIAESKEIYGKYLYNVNSTFYFWLNDWSEATAMKAEGVGAGWPDHIPPEELPSSSKYLVEHSWGEIFTRLGKGYVDEFENYWNQYTFFSYQFIYLFALIAVCVLLWPETWKAIGQHLFLIGFASGYFVGNSAIVAWWLPMAGQTNRYAFAMYVPLLFTVYFALNYLLKQREAIQLFGKKFSTQRLLNTLNWALFVLMTYDLIFTVPVRLLSRVY